MAIVGISIKDALTIISGTVDGVVVEVLVDELLTDDVVVVPGATVVVVDELVEVGVVAGIVVVVVEEVTAVVVVTARGVVVDVELGMVEVVVVLVDAAAVVVVVAGGAGMTVAVIAEEPVTETRRAWITAAVVINDEPVATIEVFGASIPELAITSFEDPSTVRSALLPRTNLMAGVDDVLPFSVTWDEPATRNFPPVSLLHARKSFVGVPHAKTSVASVPVTFEELVTLREPANQ
jgi:hypothetical protein